MYCDLSRAILMSFAPGMTSGHVSSLISISISSYSGRVAEMRRSFDSAGRSED